MGSTHIYSAFDEELKFLMRRISEMGVWQNRWSQKACAHW